MATSSRQSALFGVQDWKRIYQTYREADFMSYDYETLRKSFIDYLTTYYPETFNDYIESSEYVALLDVIAFMGQALAFRGDLNARENFIDTAERRDSVIKLANLVSYTPKRNIAANGLVKVTALSTTEDVIDINGVNLSNSVVLWNDPANPNWHEQFNSIINATLTNSQRIGRPGNTNDILNVRTEEYTINIPSTLTPVIPFNSEIDGTNMNFELVSASSLNESYIYELPPAPTGQFNMLYRNDKLGYGSANTGFFFYFKQGTLTSVEFNFAEQIENNFQQIDIENINNSDTWLYQLNALSQVVNYWTQVDNLYYRSNLEGTSALKVYTVSSRTNDQVTYNFGDNVFGEIPVGNFRAYVRASNGLTYTISPSELNGIVVTIPYISRTNRQEVLTVTVSLQTSVNNAQQRESLAQIKERAPARYYSQNRMVNAEDYTNFPFTLYNTVIKSKAVNRSSIGISRNLDLLDPTGKYSSTNIFGDDGALYVNEIPKTTTFSTLNVNLAVEFLSRALPVFLSSAQIIQYYQKYYPRYSGYYSATPDNKIYWNRSTVTENQVTGYFFVKPSPSVTSPISVGPGYSAAPMQYIFEGSQIKFLAPTGKYFGSNNRLLPGAPTPANGGRTFIWVTVLKIEGDGNNFGNGNLNDGTGPVVLSDYVPTEAYIDPTNTGAWNPATNTGYTGIIPSFDNTLSTTTVREILNLVELKTAVFALKFDNSIPANQERWILLNPAPGTTAPTDYLVKFNYNATDDSYLVTFRNRNYFFGSVSQVRFLFENNKLIYDQRTGQTINDFVTIFKTNGNPDYNPMVPSTGTAILGVDYPLYVVGQKVESDGYPDDYAVEVSTINVNNESLSYNPDFFDTIVGLNSPSYVFFKLSDNINESYNLILLPADTIVTAYNTYGAIQDIKYDFPSETVFYAKNGDGSPGSAPKFYQTQEVPASSPPVINVVEVTTQYLQNSGRSDIDFQYRHNSNNTTRIDPATTNIIDLYLVTQSYYTQYQNWLNDSTGTVPEPSRPTIDELQQQYGSLDDFKMISDSVIPNSVVFKPLFGTKAAPALQGTIKVIKSVSTTASDSQIRSSILAALNQYFTIDKWDFGDTFYMSELTAYLHVQLAGLISSVVLVPNDPDQTFGDLYQISCAPNEIFVNGATINDITVISSLTPQNLQRQA